MLALIRPRASNRRGQKPPNLGPRILKDITKRPKGGIEQEATVPNTKCLLHGPCFLRNLSEVVCMRCRKRHRGYERTHRGGRAWRRLDRDALHWTSFPTPRPTHAPAVSKSDAGPATPQQYRRAL